MSELMISPTPTQPSSSAGNANALSQSTAAKQPGDSTKPETERGTDTPFATVLKSRIDGQASFKGTAASGSDSTTATTQTASEIAPGSVDLAALFPFLGATTADATSVTPLPVATDPPTAAATAEQGLPVLPAGAEQPSQVLAALSSTPLTPIPPNPAKQHAEARHDVLAPISEKVVATTQTPGKIALDAAITADGGHTGAEKSSAELPGNEFHALMERAAAMAPVAVSQANAPASNPNLRIDTPLGQSGWHEEVGQKLTWMVGGNHQQADLVLTPPHLGRVEVSLTMNGDQATAIFTSSNPAVRDALESSLHRLREVLADAGVNLGQTHVGSESPNQSSPKNKSDSGMDQGAHHASSIQLPGIATVARTSTGRGMIDIFA